MFCKRCGQETHLEYQDLCDDCLFDYLEDENYDYSRVQDEDTELGSDNNIKARRVRLFNE